MSHRMLNIVMSIGTALLIGGCSSFNRPYPNKALYAIALGTTPGGSTVPEVSPARPLAPILRVKGIRIAKPFDTTSFVYKVGESRFMTDYYNGFIAEPDRLLTGELVKWLVASGEFGSVVEEGSTADYRLTLECNVTQLYGDYTNKKSPQAVMELKIFVIDDVPAASRVIFQKTYRQVQPLPDNTPEKLVRGWDEAYRGILTQFMSDLRSSPRVANAGLGRQSEWIQQENFAHARR